MADTKVAQPAGSEEAEVFLSASDDEAVPQVITPELLSAIVKQVEFYFSDANLPTDKKLLKQIRKDPEGFVPVKLFANFRKVRALSKDVGIIAEALRNATLLQLSQDGKRVRRIVSVPEYDVSDIQRRTIVVENLPGNPSPTIESVTEMFRVYGRVKLVRICSRESKGKLPSWLTSSCQNMGGQQHAYVEFEEEEGAILASAALAQDCDAPDGMVQVRRLLACIAEQRDRRSGTGASSFGGSSGGGSRKGSRDVSPMGSRNANSRRGSGGGAPYGSSSAYSSGGSTWTSSSAGGAAQDVYHSSFHPYRSYGGAYEHGGGSRSGSGGGAGPSPPLSFVPPPPPPPRRSCDSAPPSELLPAAAASTASATPPPIVGRSANVYRPPGKRLSDGYHCGFQPSTPGSVPASSVAGGTVPPPLQRCVCDSFGSSCGTGGTAPASAASTPTAAPSSPSPLSTTFANVNLVANSPPLATRGGSCGGVGRPPVHPPTALPPPPPLPPPPAPKSQQQQIAMEAPVANAIIPSTHTSAPAAALPSSALAEAIAQVQAERRASEAGAAKAIVTATETVPATTASVAHAAVAVAAAVPIVVPRTAPSAPKYCLDLATGVQSRPSRTSVNVLDAAPPAGQEATAKSAAASLPRGTQAQMVANVEDFINNILAGRPATRPRAHSGGGAAPFSAQQRKASGGPAAAAAAAATALGASSAVRNLAPSSSHHHQPDAVDAAVAVADILATTLRRPSVVMAAAAATPALPPAPAPCVNVPTSKPAAAIAVTMSGEPPAAAEAPTAAPAELMGAHGIFAVDNSLEHAVTVTVTRFPAPSIGASSLDWCNKVPTPALAAIPTAVAYISTSAGSVGGSPPSSPTLFLATKGGVGSVRNGAKVAGPQAASATTGGRGSIGAVQPGAKRLTRRDYAQWAAATPEFRAEASSKYASSNASGSPNSTSGGFGVRSGGGAGPGTGSGASPPPSIATLSISDGGMFGTTPASGSTNSGGGAGGYYHSASMPAPIWHVAKGPDGSKGFTGRARLLAA